jgi:septum formation protein
LSEPPIILASASPRRREILGLLGVPFEAFAMDVDETPEPGELASTLGLRVARKKAEAGAERFGPERFVLAADTVVDVDGVGLGKPVDDHDARRMIELLSGRDHHVRTAVALAHGGDVRVLESITEVRFRSLDAGTIERYVASGEGRDKAGAYAMQGLGAALVVSIAGSSSNVIGLPAAETIDLLVAAGAIPRWPLGGE